VSGEFELLFRHVWPLISEAARGFGAAVRTKATDKTAEAAIGLGPRLLQVFASRCPPVESRINRLRSSAGTPDEGEALSALEKAAYEALCHNPDLAEIVREMLASSKPGSAQAVTAGRDATASSDSHDRTLINNNFYGPTVYSDGHSGRETAGSWLSSAASGTIASGKQHSVNSAPAAPRAAAEAPRTRPNATAAGASRAGNSVRWRIFGVLAVAMITLAVVAFRYWHPGKPDDHNTTPQKIKMATQLTDPASYRSVNAVAYSPDGKTVAVGDNNGHVYLWSPASHQPPVTFTDRTGAAVYALAFSPAGKALAIGDGSGTTYLWTPASGQIEISANLGHMGVWTVAFSPNGKTIAIGIKTGATSGTTYLWNLVTREYAALPSPQGFAQSTVFTPDGKTLVTATNMGITYLWNLASRKNPVPLTPDKSGDARAVALNPRNPGNIAVGDSNGNVYLWSLATDQLTASWHDPSISTTVNPAEPSVGVLAAAFSPDGKTLVVGDSTGHVYLYSPATDQPTAHFTDPDSGGVFGLAFSPDGNTLAVGDGNGSTYLWSLPS
jgi:WD40 repeat protein